MESKRQRNLDDQPVIVYRPKQKPFVYKKKFNQDIRVIHTEPEVNENFKKFSEGTKITEQDIDFLFLLAKSFPQLILFGSIASRTQADVPVEDADIQILEDKIDKALKVLTSPPFNFKIDPKVNIFFPGTHIHKFYKLTLTLPGSTLKLDLTLGRKTGPYQYTGNEPITPANLGALQLLTVADHTKGILYPLKSAMVLCLIPTIYRPDFMAAYRVYTNELLLFPYMAYHKGYFNIAVKMFENMLARNIPRNSLEKEYYTFASDGSLLYSYGLMLRLLPDIFLEKVGGNEDGRYAIFLEIHTLIKERKNGIHNLNIIPHLNAYFDARCAVHPDAKFLTDLIKTRNVMIDVLKKLYKKSSYPKTEPKIVQKHFRLVVNLVMNFYKKDPEASIATEVIDDWVKQLKASSSVMTKQGMWRPAPITVPAQKELVPILPSLQS